MQCGGSWTENEARLVLGLARDAPLAAWRPAFSLAIRSAHPDLGGTPHEAQRIIEAYRYLKAAETERHKPTAAGPCNGRPPGPRQLEISVEEAVLGVRREAFLESGQAFRVRLPAGLRRGDQVVFEPGGERWCVEIADRPDARVQGSDLWLTFPVASALLKHGGPLTVAMPGGERRLWVSRSAAAARLIEVEGAGLPARGHYDMGRAFIQLAVGTREPLSSWARSRVGRVG